MLDLQAKLMIAPTIAPPRRVEERIELKKKNLGGLTNWYHYLKNVFINVINPFFLLKISVDWFENL